MANSTSLASLKVSTPSIVCYSCPSEIHSHFLIRGDSTADIEGMKSQADLATSVDNTFIQLLDEAFTDYGFPWQSSKPIS